jgi:hypothetical protein
MSHRIMHYILQKWTLMHVGNNMPGAELRELIHEEG